MRTSAALAVALSASMAVGSAVAAGPEDRPPESPAVGARAFADRLPVGDAVLAAARGGFVRGGELVASFAFERTTTIDGRAVVSQTVRIADLARVSAAEATALRDALGQAAGVVVRNAESGRTIRNATVIEATTNSLGFLQRGSAARAIDEALRAPLARP